MKIKPVKKVNKTIAYLRLLFGFCPNCNSDAPKKDTCKICNNGQYKSRKDLRYRFEMFDLLHLSDDEKNSVANCIDWMLRVNDIEHHPMQEILSTTKNVSK
jgi:hypothetical protein